MLIKFQKNKYEGLRNQIYEDHFNGLKGNYFFLIAASELKFFKMT